MSTSGNPTPSSSAVQKSSFPVDKIAVSKGGFLMNTLRLNESFLSLPKEVRHDEYKDPSFLSLPKEVHHDEYKDPSYDMQFPQFSAPSHPKSLTGNTAVRSALLHCMFCV